MKIKNKYLRNRHFHNKDWKRIRNQSHPFETYMPYLFGMRLSDWETQVKRNFESIDRDVRALEGGKNGWFNAPSCYRRIINRQRKAKEKNALRKINNGDYDIEIPQFRRNANWEYF